MASLEGYTTVIGRCSREAWLCLQQLRDYPRLDLVMSELEKIPGTLLPAHIEAVFQKTLSS